ncbi:unnamed protein product, partial [marine sediment metagenome]
MKLPDKLRIACVVEGSIHTTTKRGIILFGESYNGEVEPIRLYPDIEMEQDYTTFYHNRLISTVIDTRNAKGNDALGAFLCMVAEYRYHCEDHARGGCGLDWSGSKINTDPAYVALQALYENGVVEDE